MKPEEMDQQKLLTWIEEFLKKSKEKLGLQREAFYDLVNSGQDDAAERQLRDMVVGQAVHSMLLEEFLEAKEYEKMQEVIKKLAENAPEA